jgi:hypothetical protein
VRWSKIQTGSALRAPSSLPVNDANLKYEKDHEHIYAILKHETHHAYDEELVVEQDDMPQVQYFLMISKGPTK